MDYIYLCLLIAAILPACKAECRGGYFGVGCTQRCQCPYEFVCLADGSCPDRFKNGAQYYFFVENQVSHGVAFDAFLVSPNGGTVEMKTYKNQLLDSTRSVNLERQVTKNERLRRENEFTSEYIYHFSSTNMEFLIKVFITDRRNVIQLLRLYEVKTWGRHYHILVTRAHQGATVMSLTNSTVTYSPSMRFNEVIQLTGLKLLRISFQWTHLSAARGGCIISSNPTSVVLLGRNSSHIKYSYPSEIMMPVNMFGFSWFPFYNEGVFDSMFYYMLPGFAETFFTVNTQTVAVKRVRYLQRVAYFEKIQYDKSLTSVKAAPNPGSLTVLFGPNELVASLSCDKFLNYRYHFVVPVVNIRNFEQHMLIMAPELENFRVNNYTLTNFLIRGTVSTTLKYGVFAVKPTDNFIISRSGRVFGCYLYGKIKNLQTFGYVHAVPEPFDFRDVTPKPMTTASPIQDCENRFYGEGCKTKCTCPNTNVCFQDGRCPLPCPAQSFALTYCKDKFNIDYFPSSTAPRTLADGNIGTCAFPIDNKVDINLLQEAYLAGVSIILEVADEYDASLYDVEDCGANPPKAIPLRRKEGIPEISNEIILKFVEMQIMKCLRVKIGGKITLCEVKIHGGRSLLYKDAEIGTPESSSVISTVDRINKCVGESQEKKYEITFNSETWVNSIAFYSIVPSATARVILVICVDNNHRLVYHKAVTTISGHPSFFNINMNVKKVYFEVVDGTFHPCELQIFGDNTQTGTMYSSNFQEMKTAEGAYVLTGVLLYFLFTFFI